MDDYGYFGKGSTGYAHYTQATNNGGGGNGGGGGFGTGCLLVQDTRCYFLLRISRLPSSRLPVHTHSDSAGLVGWDGSLGIRYM